MGLGVKKKRCNSMKTVGVIPARYASSRFEGKPLVDIRGKPMIQHVYERASRAKRLDEIVVATDDSRIHDAVRGFGGKVVMTPEFPTGTDRVAYVAEHLRCDVVANLQGDEPLLEPMMLDQMIQPFQDNPEVQVSTLKQRVDNEAEYRDVNVVKVVTDLDGFALYFSRASIPGNLSNDWIETNPIYRHVGLYAYRKECLLTFTKWARAPYESSEGLEQLRFMEHGVGIRVVETEHRLIGVDVPADLERVLSIME